MTDGSDPGRFEIVTVTPDDWAEHSRLRLDMLLETPDAFLTTYAQVADLDEWGWRTRIAAQRHLQARLNGRPVGSVGIWDAPDEVGTTTLIAMYVVPDARRRGVAARLVQAVIDDAQRRGQERVRLEVTSSNTAAIELYARMGFVDTGMSSPHPRKKDLHELVMDRPLVAHPPTWKADPMSDVTVRPLGEEDWQEFRSIRLAALTDSPDAFVASVDEEQDYDESFWRERMRRSTRLVAEREQDDGIEQLGVVSLGQARDEEGRIGEIFGLWVAPSSRGTGVATRLVEAAAERALKEGRSHVAYWVGTDNGRAVAFASGIGFRPTDFRRSMRVQSDDGEEEIAMLLPVGDDRVRPVLL